MAVEEVLNPVRKLIRDILVGAKTMSTDEARFLVSTYYRMQNNRIRSRGQERALIKSEEPHEILTWFGDQFEVLESQIKKALDVYTQGHVMGAWMRSIYGIGPVISAGLLANIDIERAPTAGHIWSLAGWAADGQKPWVKGKIKPFSSPLRQICWFAGQSFMKFAAEEECFYGHIYRDRKALEIANNEKLLYADQAAKSLARLVRKDSNTAEYNKLGKLSPGHIDARARRYAVKIFLSHLHQHWYQAHFGKPAPLPFAIAHLGHAHMIHPPGFVQKEYKTIVHEQPAPKVKKMKSEKQVTKTVSDENVPAKKRGRPKKSN